MTTITPPGPATTAGITVPMTDEEAVEEVSRLLRLRKPELRQAAEARGLSVRGTKADIISRLTGRLLDQVPGHIPPFEVPGPDASSEEMIQAILDEAAQFQAKMQFVRNWGIRQHRYGRGQSGRPCSSGTEGFMQQFGLPPYYGANGQPMYHVQVPSDMPADFSPAHYTAAGLRHYLELRMHMHAQKISEMREYGVSNRSYFSPDALQQVLEVIGAQPWEPQYEISFGAMPRFTLPRSHVRDRRALERQISEAISQAVISTAGEGTEMSARWANVNVSITETG